MVLRVLLSVQHHVKSCLACHATWFAINRPSSAGCDILVSVLPAHRCGCLAACLGATAQRVWSAVNRSIRGQQPGSSPHSSTAVHAGSHCIPHSVKHQNHGCSVIIMHMTRVTQTWPLVYNVQLSYTCAHGAGRPAAWLALPTTGCVLGRSTLPLAVHVAANPLPVLHSMILFDCAFTLLVSCAGPAAYNCQPMC